MYFKDFLVGIIYLRAEEHWVTINNAPITIWKADKILMELLIKQQDIRSKTTLNPGMITRGRNTIIGFVTKSRENAIFMKRLDFQTY